MMRVLSMLVVVPFLLVAGCAKKKCEGETCYNAHAVGVERGQRVQLEVGEREATIATLIDGFGEAARPTFWLADATVVGGQITIVASDDAPAGVHTLIVDHGSGVTAVDVEVR